MQASKKYSPAFAVTLLAFSFTANAEESIAECRGIAAGVVVSMKAAGEIKSPCTGVVVAVNERLGDNPEVINASPMDDGWLLKIQLSDASQVGDHMDEDSYLEYVSTLD